MAVRKLSTGFGQIWLKVSIFGITKFNSIYLTRRRENNPHSIAVDTALTTTKLVGAQRLFGPPKIGKQQANKSVRSAK